MMIDRIYFAPPAFEKIQNFTSSGDAFPPRHDRISSRKRNFAARR
ncbi:hypothetical protein [Pyramidobacter sp. C12-8]|nr:hypothetical protein [Pyramidobacter sp. C12-8]